MMTENQSVGSWSVRAASVSECKLDFDCAHVVVEVGDSSLYVTQVSAIS